MITGGTEPAESIFWETEAVEANRLCIHEPFVNRTVRCEPEI